MTESSTAESHRPGGRRTLALAVSFAALLGLFAYPRALPWLGPHVRRVGAELFGGPVPFDGWPLASVGVLVALVALAGLLASAARRRISPAVPLVALTFALALLVGYVYRISAHDQGGERRAAAVAWMRDLGALRVPFDDMTLVGGKDGRFFGAVRTAPEGFEVFDCADGRTVWKGTSNASHPLSGADGVLVLAEGKTVSARSLDDGRTQATWTGANPIQTIHRLEGGFIVALPNGSLVGLDANLHQRWSTPACAAPITTVLMPPASLLVVESHTARLLDAQTGAVRWRRPLNTGGVLHGRATRSGLLVLLGADGIHGLDAATGADRMSVLHMASSASEMANISVLDTDAFIVQDGFKLSRVSLEGRVEWAVDARGETLSLHDRGLGAGLIVTGGGKVLGLDMATGRVIWEWWRGGLAEHLAPSQSTPLAYAQPHLYPMVQETPGAPLCLLDVASGRVTSRLEMPAGLRVRRVLDDGRQLIVLGRGADDHSIVLALPRPPEMEPPT